MVNNDIQLQEQLLSHYESAVNHNFEINKMRYEREYDTWFKTGGMGAMMLFPVYGQFIDTGLNAFESISLYEDFYGNNVSTFLSAFNIAFLTSEESWLFLDDFE